MDIEALLAPVKPDAPCGEDLTFSSELDAIARARQADDPSLEQGAWVTTLKEADWKFVAGACSRLLQTKSKDLRLAVWLCEAAAKTAGLRALGEALLVTAGLCARYWDGLYPLPDEGSFEQRIGNLSWVAARVAQLARELPVARQNGAAYSLNDFAFARAHAQAGQGGGAPAAAGLPELAVLAKSRPGAGTAARRGGLLPADGAPQPRGLPGRQGGPLGGATPARVAAGGDQGRRAVRPARGDAGRHKTLNQAAGLAGATRACALLICSSTVATAWRVAWVTCS